MKLILFMYFSGVYSHPPKKYTTEPHSKALSMIYVQWGLFLNLLLLALLHRYGIWELLVQYWPYEYGRTHSRNWTTPTAVCAIGFYVIFHQLVKKYFKQESVQKEIVAHFDNELGRSLSDRTEWWLIAQIVFSTFAGVMFFAENYRTFACCFLVWAAAEIWIRKVFYGTKLESKIKSK